MAEGNSSSVTARAQGRTVSVTFVTGQQLSGANTILDPVGRSEGGNIGKK
jgi:hypothetical protein